MDTPQAHTLRPPHFLATLLGHLSVLMALEAIAYALLVDYLLPTAVPLVRLAAFAGCYVAFRVLSVALLFGIAWIWRNKRSAAQSIGLRATLRLFLAETSAFFRLYLGYHLLEPLLGTREPAKLTPGQRPILFIHGFVCNGGYFTPLLRALARRGIVNLYTINCSPPFGNIDRFAAQVALRVESILAQTGADQVILVGHSMGGLIARAYVQKLGGAPKVAKIITLGTPHHGTAHAWFSHAPDARQMRPGNAWLNTLNGAPEAGVKTTSIYSLHDNIVAPQDNAHIDFGKNIVLIGIGHLELSFAPAVQAAVYEELKSALHA